MNVSTALLTYPHLTAGILLLALAFRLYHDALKAGDHRRALASGIVGLALGFAHVYDVVTFLAVSTAAAVTHARRRPAPSEDPADVPRSGPGPTAAPPAGPIPAWISRHLLVVAPCIVPLIYHGVAFAVEDSLTRWGQTAEASPSPMVYALGLGFAAPLALWWLTCQGPANGGAGNGGGTAPAAPGAHGQVGRRFLGTWVVVQAALLYSGPFVPFERRFVEGLQIPVVLLATQALSHLWERTAGRAVARAAIVLAMACALPTGLYTVWAQLGIPRNHPFYFRDAAEVIALEGLGRLVGPEGVILCTAETGLLVPALSARRVVVGQRVQTADFDRRYVAVQRFFGRGGTPEERRAVLLDHGVTHVYWGSLERGLGPVGAPLSHGLADRLETIATFGPHRLDAVRRPVGRPGEGAVPSASPPTGIGRGSRGASSSGPQTSGGR